MSLFGEIAGSLLGEGTESLVAGHLTQLLAEHTTPVSPCNGTASAEDKLAVFASAT